MSTRDPENSSKTADASLNDSQRHVRDVLNAEAKAILNAATKIDGAVDNAVELLMECKGRVIVTGMGKMGLIARKATATFCSTGTPAIFLHPSEALHGDLGIVSKSDVVVALSNSGETAELLELMPFMHRLGVSVLALTGNENSPLASLADVVIDTHVENEADPIALAPTNSTAVVLAMCDALAVALMHRRGFTREQFAIFHPGGNLGRKLLLTVAGLMVTGERIPSTVAETTLREAIVLISKKGLGAAAIVDENQKLVGILTDGDLRRSFEKKDNPLDDQVGEHMTTQPTTLVADALAAEALKVMEDRGITVLPVTDKDQKLVGVIHLHDLIRAGLA